MFQNISVSDFFKTLDESAATLRHGLYFDISAPDYLQKIVSITIPSLIWKSQNTPLLIHGLMKSMRRRGVPAPASFLMGFKVFSVIQIRIRKTWLNLISFTPVNHSGRISFFNMPFFPHIKNFVPFFPTPSLCHPIRLIVIVELRKHNSSG